MVFPVERDLGTFGTVLLLGHYISFDRSIGALNLVDFSPSFREHRLFARCLQTEIVAPDA
jgi:hypothetical protein